ncbi:MAG: hypothetical protein F9K16_02030 [Thermoanaerobaculia bacterium]|nr:MAG: hypothetical protein F9K16_02030 [Thermoanaerobaculia bacterium]
MAVARWLAVFGCFASALPAGAELRVLDERGTPVAGARVVVVLPVSPELPGRKASRGVTGVTDEEGRLPFALPRAPGGLLVVDAPDFAPRALPLAGTADEGVLVLEGGETLTGQVVDDAGRPVESGSACAVWNPVPVELDRDFRIERCGAISAAGRFELATLARDEQSLRVQVPGFLPHKEALVVPSDPPSVRLRPGHRVRVRVLAESVLVAEADLRCAGAVPVRSDAKGEALVSLPALKASCEAGHFEFGSSGPVEVSAQGESPQVLRLLPTGGVRGTVLGEDGSPIRGMRIALMEEFDGGDRSLRKLVEPELLPDGKFRLRVDHPGAVALEILADGWRPHTTGSFQTEPGAPVDLGEIHLLRGAGVSGWVLDGRSSAPVAGAVISVEPAGRARLLLGEPFTTSTLSADDGRFVASGLPSGRYRVRIESEGLAPWEEELDLSEIAIEDLSFVDLHPWVRVHGRVARSNGTALVAARVAVVRSMGREPAAVATSQTDAEGRLASFLCAPGHLRVLVSGDRLLMDQEIDIPAGPEEFELELRVPTTRLSGLVTEQGIPVGGGEVVVREVADVDASLGVVLLRSRTSGQEAWAGRPGASATAPVESDGTFTLADSPSGRLLVSYFGYDGRRASRVVDVESAPRSAVVVEVAGYSVEGEIAPALSRGGVGAEIQILNADTEVVARTRSEGTGRFAMEGVPPGTYRLKVDFPGYKASAPVDVVVTETGSAPVYVNLDRSEEDSDLLLTLRREDESLAAAVPLVLIDEANAMVRALSTGTSGALRLSSLPRGRYRVVWADPFSGTGATKPIDVTSSAKRVELDLEKGRELVVHCTGGPCAGSRLPWLSVLTADGVDLAPYLLRSSAVVFSEGGTARVGKLSPGTYRVAGMSGGHRFEKSLHVGAGPGQVDLAVPLR